MTSYFYKNELYSQNHLKPPMRINRENLVLLHAIDKTSDYVGTLPAGTEVSIS
jgi:hypothetical protein